MGRVVLAHPRTLQKGTLVRKLFRQKENLSTPNSLDNSVPNRGVGFRDH